MAHENDTGFINKRVVSSAENDPSNDISLDDHTTPNAKPHTNRDPLSGELGAHPVETGIGAAGMGTIGAVVGGAVAGPVGAIVGSAAGAIAGGLVGKSAGEELSPTVVDEYWSQHYSTQPYVEPGTPYEDYQSAYYFGHQAYGRYANTGHSYDELEPELRRDYETGDRNPNLAWEKAKYAVRDAWDRASNTLT